MSKRRRDLADINTAQLLAAANRAFDEVFDDRGGDDDKVRQWLEDEREVCLAKVRTLELICAA